MTHIHKKLTDFVKESVFEDLPEESSDISINLDTTIEVDENDNAIIPEDDYMGIEIVLDTLRTNNVDYNIYEEDGFPNQIELTGSLENIKKVLKHWDAHQRSEEELQIALQDWTGDEDELTNIIC